MSGRDDIQVTLTELSAMAQHLQDYLLGDRLFKTITVPGEPSDQLIKMTLGGMLERLSEVRRHGGAEAERVAQATEEALQLARRAMPDQFFHMLGREAKSYTDSWQWFLQNCWEGDGRCTSDYAQEVGIRLRLARLLDHGGDHPELAASRQRLDTLDQRLRAIWQPADSPLRQDGDFSPDRHWWLYGRPVPQEGSD